MTRDEEIKQAAYSQYCNSESLCFTLMCDSFRLGAKWADNHPKNVWHDASEVPNENTSIVFIWYGNLIHKLEIIPNVDKSFYSWLTANRYIKQWAYIDDILPKGGKK